MSQVAAIISDPFEGAEYAYQEIVEDGNLVSSRHPGDLPAFIEASLKRLG